MLRFGVAPNEALRPKTRHQNGDFTGVQCAKKRGRWFHGDFMVALCNINYVHSLKLSLPSIPSNLSRFMGKSSIPMSKKWWFSHEFPHFSCNLHAPRNVGIAELADGHCSQIWISSGWSLGHPGGGSCHMFHRASRLPSGYDSHSHGKSTINGGL